MPARTEWFRENAPFVKRMEPALDRARALLGGTDAMREAGEKYLPRFPGEHQDTYKWRLGVATLAEFYEAMAAQMVGLMLSGGVKVANSKLPPEILDNIDRNGAKLEHFAAELATALLTKGRPHILVDHPEKPDSAATLEDDKKLGLRPYWVLIEPSCVFQATMESQGGIERLTRFLWRENAMVAKGYEQAGVARVRVLRKDGDVCSFEVWERERDTEPYSFVNGGVMSGPKNALKSLPLETLYANRQAFMVAKPSLDAVAHKNIEHWQSSADQRHILTVTRFPIQYQIGTKEPIPLSGPYTMFHTDGVKNDVEIGFAEAQGHGIAAGERDLARIVSEMEALAVRLVTSDAAKTESGEQADFKKEGSPLQRLVVEIERGMNEALKHTAAYLDLPPEAAGTVNIPKDGLSISADDAKALDALIKLRASGDISRVTILEEMQTRGMLKTPTFEPKRELERISAEEDTAAERALKFQVPPDEEDEEEGAGNQPPGVPAKKTAA